MTTRTLRSAIAALAFMALSCGGGSDPPGGGNGDTDGGDTDVNLIEAIPGRWRVVRAAGQPVPPGMYEGDVRVDANDPDCRQRIAAVFSAVSPGVVDPTGGAR